MEEQKEKIQFGVFQIRHDSETYWIAAPNVEAAIAHYIKETDSKAEEIETAKELPRKLWKDRKIVYCDEPGEPELTFEEIMEGMNWTETIGSTNY